HNASLLESRLICLRGREQALALLRIQPKAPPAPVGSQILFERHRELIFHPIYFALEHVRGDGRVLQVVSPDLFDNHSPSTQLQRLDPFWLFRPVVVTPAIECTPLNRFGGTAFETGEASLQIP